jgi:isopentenyl diphosphate isomerase/L-lactate dehydrogenase-like FMN-dependent dehydrogenase
VVDDVCLQDVEWLKSITSLPILLKGIVTAEDGNIINKSTYSNYP